MIRAVLLALTSSVRQTLAQRSEIGNRLHFLVEAGNYRLLRWNPYKEILEVVLMAGQLCINPGPRTPRQAAGTGVAVYGRGLKCEPG